MSWSAAEVLLVKAADNLARPMAAAVSHLHLMETHPLVAVAAVAIFQVAVLMVILVVLVAAVHGRLLAAVQVIHLALLHLKVITAHLVRLVEQQEAVEVQAVHLRQQQAEWAIHLFQLGHR
jgi:hypothetical protein